MAWKLKAHSDFQVKVVQKIGAKKIGAKKLVQKIGPKLMKTVLSPRQLLFLMVRN